MLTIEFDGTPFGSLDASKTRESTKCQWVGVVEGTAGGKNRERVTAPLCLMFKGCGGILGTSAKQIS